MDNEEFTLTPSLSEAMMANPFKSVLMLGVTFYAGAFVGKKKTDKALQNFGGIVRTGVGKGAKIARQTINKGLDSKGQQSSLPAPKSQGALNRGHYYY